MLRRCYRLFQDNSSVKIPSVVAGGSHSKGIYNNHGGRSNKSAAANFVYDGRHQTLSGDELHHEIHSLNRHPVYRYRPNDSLPVLAEVLDRCNTISHRTLQMAFHLAHGCKHYQYCIRLYLKRQRSHQNDIANSLIDDVIDSAYYHGNMDQLKECVVAGIHHLRNTPDDIPTSVAVVRGFWRIVCLWSRLRRRIVKQQGAASLNLNATSAEREANREALDQAVEGIDASAQQAAAEVWETLHLVNGLEGFRSCPFDRVYRATQQCVLYGQETDEGECHFYRMAWQHQLFSTMLIDSAVGGNTPLPTNRQPLTLQVAMLKAAKQGQWVDAAQSFFDEASEGLDSVEEVLVHHLFAVFKEAKEHGRISSVGGDLIRRGANFSSTMLRIIGTAGSEEQQRDVVSLVFDAMYAKASASEDTNLAAGGQFEDEEGEGNSASNSVSKFSMFMCLAALGRVGDPDFHKRMNDCIEKGWVNVGDEARVFLLLQHANHAANPVAEAAPAIAILKKAAEDVDTLNLLVSSTRRRRQNHDSSRAQQLLSDPTSRFFENTPGQLEDQLREANEALTALHSERNFHQLINYQLITEDPGMVDTFRTAVDGRGYFQWRWLERLVNWASKRRYNLSADDQQYIVALVKKHQKKTKSDSGHVDELAGLDKIRAHYSLLLHDVETQSCRNFAERGVVTAPPKLQDPATYFLRKGKKTVEMHPDRNVSLFGALPREPITGTASVASLGLRKNKKFHNNTATGALLHTHSSDKSSRGNNKHHTTSSSSSSNGSFLSSPSATFEVTNEMRLSTHLLRAMSSMQREGDGGFLLSASASGLGGGNVTSVGRSARGAFGKKRSMNRLTSFHKERLANAQEAIAHRLKVTASMSGLT